MTKDGAEKYPKEIEALRKGETIQRRDYNKMEWQDDLNPSFDIYGCEFRIKPRIPREWWLVSPKGMGMAGNEWCEKYLTEAKAKERCSILCLVSGCEVIHVREML